MSKEEAARTGKLPPAWTHTGKTKNMVWNVYVKEEGSYTSHVYLDLYQKATFSLRDDGQTSRVVVIDLPGVAWDTKMESAIGNSEYITGYETEYLNGDKPGTRFRLSIAKDVLLEDVQITLPSIYKNYQLQIKLKHQPYNDNYASSSINERKSY